MQKNITEGSEPKEIGKSVTLLMGDGSEKSGRIVGYLTKEAARGDQLFVKLSGMDLIFPFAKSQMRRKFFLVEIDS